MEKNQKTLGSFKGATPKLRPGEGEGRENTNARTKNGLGLSVRKRKCDGKVATKGHRREKKDIRGGTRWGGEARERRGLKIRENIPSDLVQVYREERRRETHQGATSSHERRGVQR